MARKLDEKFNANKVRKWGDILLWKEAFGEDLTKQQYENRVAGLLGVKKIPIIGRKESVLFLPDYITSLFRKRGLTEDDQEMARLRTQSFIGYNDAAHPHFKGISMFDYVFYQQQGTVKLKHFPLRERLRQRK